MGEGTCDVGLNTVLGGASFVTCVVVGIISISRGRRVVRVHKSAFIRDVCFFTFGSCVFSCYIDSRGN